MWNKKKSGLSLVNKSHFYVCFLGARESNGLKGTNVVMPVLTTLLRNSYDQEPSKVTLQLSEKGVKIVQNVPVITRSGKLKSDVIKFLVPHYSISFAMVGPPPHDDTIGCVFLIFNPETRCCVHVHCYRCDSAATAALLNASMQALINRPDNIKRFTELEYRLRIRGLLDGPSSNMRNSELDLLDRCRPSDIGPNGPTPRGLSSNRTVGNMPQLSNRGKMFHSTGNLCHPSNSYPYEDLDMVPNPYPSEMGDYNSDRGDGNRVSMLHSAVFDELKQKLKNREKCPILFPPKDYLSTWKNLNKATRPQVTKQVGGIWDVGGHRSNFIAAAAYGSNARDQLSSGREFQKFHSPDLIDHGLFPSQPPAKHALETSSTSGVGSDSSSTESSGKPKDYSQTTTSDDYSEIGMGVAKRSGAAANALFPDRNRENSTGRHRPSAAHDDVRRSRQDFDGGVNAREIKYIDSSNTSYSHTHSDSNASSDQQLSSATAQSNKLSHTPRAAAPSQTTSAKIYHSPLKSEKARTKATVENPENPAGKTASNRYDYSPQIKTKRLDYSPDANKLYNRPNNGYNQSRSRMVASQHNLTDKYSSRECRERDYPGTRQNLNSDTRIPPPLAPFNPSMINNSANKKECRAFGDTMKYEIKPSYQITASNLDSVGKDRSKLAHFAASSNWMINKPTRFFSVEDLSVARSRRSVVEATPMRESLWHLPSLVDPFGKLVETEPNNLPDSTRDAQFTSRKNKNNYLGGYANRRGALIKSDRAQKCASWYVAPSTQF